MADSDYMADFVHMPKDGWFSGENTSFDLGWIDGLYKVADKSMDNLFGTYDYQLNEDDLFGSIAEAAGKFPEDGKGAIVYAALWIVAVVLFAVTGFLWCLCNKFVCCCRSSFEATEDNEANGCGKPSTGAIVVSAAMTLWLIFFFLMFIHTFGANEKTNDAIDHIKPDLESTFKDILRYLQITVKQLEYIFVTSFHTFSSKVNDALTNCSGDPSHCGALRKIVEERLDSDITKQLLTGFETLNTTLTKVQHEAGQTKDGVDKKSEDVLTDTNDGLYWLFLLINILYLATFGLVLTGTVLVVFVCQPGFKTLGYLLMRLAIVIMFVLGTFAVFQLVFLFISGGLISKVVCPTIRRLESEMTTGEERFLFETRSLGSYEVPSASKIVRRCKMDRSAYMTFELSRAFDLKAMEDEVIKKLDPDDLIQNSQDSNIDAVKTAQKILDEVKLYIQFIRHALTDEVGKCKPTYNALNGVINLFCNKVAAPVISFWWILQFILPLFVLIIITAMVFERYHF